jgi:signal transduction histidine kinase
MPDVEIPFDWVSDRVLGYADPSRIRQIIRNLVTNAVRYGGPDRRIRVMSEGAWSIVEVSDDGPELPEDRREAIFAPYSRGELSASMPGSIGLGLTVSRTLARLQGGDLMIVREAGRNAFRVAVPQSVEAAVAVTSGVSLD